jgi:hypothetical protein
MARWHNALVRRSRFVAERPLILIRLRQCLIAMIIERLSLIYAIDAEIKRRRTFVHRCLVWWAG